MTLLNLLKALRNIRLSESGVGRFFLRILDLPYICRYMALPMLLASLNRRKLVRVRGEALASPRSKVVVVAPFYGNEELLSHFLGYYSRLGADEFVFLDLSSRQNLAERVPAELRVAIWRPRSLRSLAPAIHWLNFLRRRYATGRWCLSVEPTDYFVFPASEMRHLRDLAEFLENEGRKHIYALRLIMYGEEAAAETQFAADDPLAALPYFDALGYTCRADGPFNSAVTRGGVERRALFALEPVRAPAVQRIPFRQVGAEVQLHRRHATDGAAAPEHGSCSLAHIPNRLFAQLRSDRRRDGTRGGRASGEVRFLRRRRRAKLPRSLSPEVIGD